MLEIFILFVHIEISESTYHALVTWSACLDSLAWYRLLSFLRIVICEDGFLNYFLKKKTLFVWIMKVKSLQLLNNSCFVFLRIKCFFKSQNFKFTSLKSNFRRSKKDMDDIPHCSTSKRKICLKRLRTI